MEFPLQRVWVSHPLSFSKPVLWRELTFQFHTQFISSASVILLVKFSSSFVHFIKTIQPIHYGKANIRIKVALQEMSFD